MRAFRIAYDGRPYHGFQRQPDVETVEDALFDALADLDALDQRPPEGYAAAGRTDAGVSALAQTVSLDAPDWLDPSVLNGQLPSSVRAWASADVRGDFHAQHHASSREYTYFLHAPTADEHRLERALEALAGDHDFHNLTPDGQGTRRTLETDYRRDGAFLVCTFRAGGFPRQLVRRAVSLVAEVVRGDHGLDRIERVLGPQPLLGPEGISPASPEPLVLTDVSYDVRFEREPEAIEQTRERFHRLHVERTSRARVAQYLLENV